MQKGIRQAIMTYAALPLHHQLLVSLLKDYKRPNDKIHELIKEGILTPVKKGLYIVGPLLDGKRPESYLVANHIFGPSYVSLETALSFHGLIPERVYEITSMTIKPSKQFSTPIGLFTYTRLPLPYYAFGIQQVQFDEQQIGLMASPEKSLCDKIVTTPGVLFRSIQQANEYLVENLRIDEESLGSLNVKLIKEWLNDAPKKESLEFLCKLLETL